MSKCDYAWKPALNWACDGDYSYLEKASNEEFAWEFLRRNSEYLKLWHRLKDRPHLFEKNIYRPKKRAKECDAQWQKRVHYDLNIRKKPFSIAQHYGKQFGLAQLYNPYLGFEQGVKFEPVRSKPEMILTLDHFEDTVNEVFFKNGSSCMCVDNQRLVLMFDLQDTADKQFKKAKEIFKAQKRQRQIQSRRNNGTKKAHWPRKIRVFDALYSLPRPKNLEIGKKFHVSGCGDIEYQKKANDYRKSSFKAVTNYSAPLYSD